MKLKLTSTQNNELIASLTEQQKAEDNFIIAREQFIKAQQTRARTVNLIADSHHIDLRKYSQDNMRLENGYLLLDENGKPTLNQKTHAKAKTEK